MEKKMTNKKDITSVELMDLIPLGDHRVIIDSFEKREYDDFTYLDFQLVGLEEEACDKEIKHGVPYPKSGKTTGSSKLGKLIKASFPTAEGKIDFENDLLQKSGPLAELYQPANSILSCCPQKVFRVT